MERGKCNQLVLILQNIVLITLQEICFNPITKKEKEKKRKKKSEICFEFFSQIIIIQLLIIITFSLLFFISQKEGDE